MDHSTTALATHLEEVEEDQWIKKLMTHAKEKGQEEEEEEEEGPCTTQVD